MKVIKAKCNQCGKEVKNKENNKRWITIEKIQIVLKNKRYRNDIEFDTIEYLDDLDFCNRECLNSYLKENDF